jgi:2-iminobutanoate/2-iminopropanoate deaminase
MSDVSDATRRWTPVQPSDTPPPAGAYSPGVRAGNLLFVSGQVPRDPVTGALAGDDIATQTRQVMQNLTRVLEAAGATRRDLVSVTVYLTDVDDWGTFDGVYREFMEPPFPTRAVVGSELRGIRVEIAAVAMVGV